MKVLLLIDSLGSGGAQRQMVTLAALMKQGGEEISFLTYADEGFFLDAVEKLNINVHIIHSKCYLQRIWRVRNYIRSGKFNAVISFMDTPNFLNNCSAFGGKNWKVITSERSSQEEYFKTTQGKIYGWFQRFSDTIVCNSRNSMAMWEKHYPEYKNKLEVIYNLVLLPEIKSKYFPRRDGKLNIIVAASYQYLKNPLRFIDAIRLLSDKDREKLSVNWYGRIEVTIGDTRAYDESIALIKKFNLENIVTLNEPTKDIANRMQESDVVALFSEVEGLPNAICEGMRLGKPILMTKVSDYMELVDSNNGLVCEWDNADLISKALSEMINLTERELLVMGQKSQEKSNVIFSEKEIINKWMLVLNKSNN